MGCSRHPRLAPLAAAPLFAILVLTSGVAAACPPDAPQGERTAGLIRPHSTRIDGHGRTTPHVHGRYQAAAAPRWAPWQPSSGPQPIYGTNPHPRRFRPSPLLVVAIAAGLMWLALRGFSPGPAQARAVPPSPNSVVSLACRRCSRVVDLPRQRLNLTRHVFCPRCGATLPRDV